MSYLSVAQMTSSDGLVKRLVACAAIEQIDQPYGWVTSRLWTFAAQPGWGDAWASALASAPDVDPGAREDVITDGMILAAVQALRDAS